MIEEIRIRGLGVIDDAVLEPHSAFTVVTGETGAGKTMVLTGLGLLLGAKADAGRVRTGDQRCEVDGRFTVGPDSMVATRVGEAGGDLDEGSLLVARTVSGEGRSRAYVGGRPVPAAVLADLAEGLVAVHGQSDQQRLLRPGRQRRALDRFAGAPVVRCHAGYAAVWERLQVVETDLAEVTARARERAQEADMLRHGVAEIAAAHPQPGEDEQLRVEAGRLSHAEALREAAESAHTELTGTEETPGANALSLVVSARRLVDAQRDHDDQLAALGDRLAELAIVTADVSADLAAYFSGVDSDPVRLAAVEERRADLGALTRKFGESIDDVLRWAEHGVERLADLDGDDERVAGLRAERDSLRVDLASRGSALTAARERAAASFGAAVTVELAGLAMPHAQLVADVRPLAVAGPHGMDEVELLLTPHAGAPSRPLARAASGGELSRVMLAVEVVLAGSDPVPCMVFDEVDAGVGGKAAVEVGRRLARLARSTQVLVVTHLAQVAAFADRHVVVEKADDGRVTTAGLRTVQGEDRVRELARMMAGMESSQAAGAHAQELLDLAAAEREPQRRTSRKAPR